MKKLRYRLRLALHKVRLFVLGGQEKDHWCWNCAQVVHPNVVQRLGDFLNMKYVEMENRRWLRTHREGGMDIRYTGPARSFEVGTTEPPLDPVYYGPAVPLHPGAPVPPPEMAGLPVYIPAREPIIPQRPPIKNFFPKLVDAMDQRAFMSITGARISEAFRYEPTGTPGLDYAIDAFQIELLVGEDKEPYGRLHNRRNGKLCIYKSRASARRAKSRFLKRLAAGDIGLKINRKISGFTMVTREQEVTT